MGQVTGVRVIRELESPGERVQDNGVAVVVLRILKGERDNGFQESSWEQIVILILSSHVLVCFFFTILGSSQTFVHGAADHLPKHTLSFGFISVYGTEVQKSTWNFNF